MMPAQSISEQPVPFFFFQPIIQDAFRIYTPPFSYLSASTHHLSLIYPHLHTTFLLSIPIYKPPFSYISTSTHHLSLIYPQLHTTFLLSIRIYIPPFSHPTCFKQFLSSFLLKSGHFSRPRTLPARFEPDSAQGYPARSFSEFLQHRRIGNFTNISARTQPSAKPFSPLICKGSQRFNSLNKVFLREKIKYICTELNLFKEMW